MTSSLKRKEWIIPLLFVMALAATISVGTNVWGGSTADAQGTSDDPSDVINADGFTPPGDQSAWPPRPRGTMTELVPTGPIAGDAASDSFDLAPWTVVVTRPEVAAEVGNDFNHLSTSNVLGGKGLPDTGTEYVFFSRDKNQTVVVFDAFVGEGSIETLDPRIAQPIFTAEELAEATQLAKDFFVANGNPEAVNLDGHGIRALTPEGNLYPVRMVSIHLGVDAYAYPELGVLVDLTNRTVIKESAAQ